VTDVQNGWLATAPVPSDRRRRPWLNPESWPFPIDGRELIVANNA
jgi:hypothetical protein